MRGGILLISLLLIAAATAVAGCTDIPAPADDNILTVAVSIVPEETFVRKIAGNNAEIITMIPPGYSPETYEPTPQQMQKLAAADVYFAIGVPAEQKILSSIHPETLLIPLQNTVAEIYPDRIINNGRDPHIWLSPKRASIMITEIAETLAELDTGNAEIYRKNADSYRTEIDDAAEYAENTLKSVTGKTFITTHPAFGYFADEYGLVMESLEEDEKEATVSHLQKLINLASAKNIRTVFYQKEAGTVQASAFAEEIGGKIIPLSPLETEYTDNIRYMADMLAEAAR